MDLTAAPEGHSVLRRDFRSRSGLVRGDGGALALACLNVAGLFLARVRLAIEKSARDGIGSITRANWTAASNRQPASRICG